MAIHLQKIWDFTPVKKSSHGYLVMVMMLWQKLFKQLIGF